MRHCREGWIDTVCRSRSAITCWWRVTIRIARNRWEDWPWTQLLAARIIPRIGHWITIPRLRRDRRVVRLLVGRCGGWRGRMIRVAISALSWRRWGVIVIRRVVCVCGRVVVLCIIRGRRICGSRRVPGRIIHLICRIRRLSSLRCIRD